MTAILSIGLLARQIRYKTGSNAQDSTNGRRNTYLLAGFTGVFVILSDVTSAMVLGIAQSRVSDIPRKIISSSTQNVIAGGFAVWAIAVMFQSVFIMCLVVIRRRKSHQIIQPYQIAPKSQAQPEMQIVRRPGMQSHDGKQAASSASSSEASPSLQGMSRPVSDAMASLRSSLTNDRPMTSQTKLLGYKTSHRSASFDDVPRLVEDGFDSWDTSAVDPQARQAVELASPTHPTFLETIPASPATSRSPSPGYPLDLEPPKQRKRVRKYTLPSSQGDRPKTSPSKIESTGEAHIHPLFRAASSEPPPVITPGTIVTAAPGAGQVISSRSSIRSLNHKKSSSRPSSPVKPTDSLDNGRWAQGAVGHGGGEKLEEDSGERTLTPPIPDWIMTAGSNSMAGYHSRRQSDTEVAPGAVRDI